MEQTGLLFLFTCQSTKSSNFSRSGVNMCAHLLRKNYSRNFSSIQRAPISLTLYYTYISGLAHVDATVGALVEIMHAFTLTDLENVPLASKHYTKLLMAQVYLLSTLSLTFHSVESWGIAVAQW